MAGRILFVLTALTALGLCSHAQGAEVIDSEYLALELTGEFLPPESLVERIAADLSAIRSYDGFFAQISVFPSWVPGKLMVQVTGNAADDFAAGHHAELNGLNAQYGPLSWTRETWNPDIFIFDFERPFHAPQLAAIYGQLEDVLASVLPSGGGGHDIMTNELGTYTFKYGWGDCPAGCLYNHYWLFEVLDGAVTLLDEWGEPLTVPIDEMTWGELKDRF